MKLSDRLRNFLRRGKKLRLYAIIFMLSGLLVLGLESINRWIFVKGDLLYWDNINNGLKSLLDSIGVVLFTVGLGTITLELGEFTDYFIKRLTDVMLKDDFLNYINPVKMAEMHKKIETKLYFNGTMVGKDNFYHIARNALAKLLHSFYYKECFILVECSIDEENKLIRKNIHKSIKIINGIDKDKNGKCKSKISIPFGGEFKSIKDKGIEDIYKINSVIFKQEKISDEQAEYVIEDKTKDVNDKLAKILSDPDKYKVNEDGFYSIILDFDYEFEACESCSVELDFMSIVPITDSYFSNRLSAPCQNYTIVYNLANNDYTLDGYAFSFLKDDYGDAASIHKSENSMIIKFSDWVMPGEGIVISMKHV